MTYVCLHITHVCICIHICTQIFSPLEKALLEVDLIQTLHFVFDNDTAFHLTTILYLVVIDIL